MRPFLNKPTGYLSVQGIEIPSFLSDDQNIDWKTVESFGKEWEKFNYFSEDEIQNIGKEYFDIVPEELYNKNTAVLDVGCGSGRWTRYICDKVGYVEAIDPSQSVLSASLYLKDKENVRVVQGSVDNIPFEDNSFDLVFSLGVLHHLPDTLHAMQNCIKKVKPGGYFLVYLYYNLDNRGALFKSLFYLSNVLRKAISSFPQKIKHLVCDFLALVVYLPFVVIARVFEKIPFLKQKVSKIPLSYYRRKSFKVIRNDALDRFGTPLEKRFSKIKIESMMKESGLSEIVFSHKEPFWHAIGKKN